METSERIRNDRQVLGVIRHVTRSKQIEKNFKVRSKEVTENH